MNYFLISIIAILIFLSCAYYSKYHDAILKLNACHKRLEGLNHVPYQTKKIEKVKYQFEVSDQDVINRKYYDSMSSFMENRLERAKLEALEALTDGPFFKHEIIKHREDLDITIHSLVIEIVRQDG